ncbi:protein TALPID3, partial [Centroberyx affinis]|uniref:protein TALPID3 n=1 Tax=Centroberyx affinis TaxID=166261 RepID=UPI003A5BA8DC
MVLQRTVLKVPSSSLFSAQTQSSAEHCDNIEQEVKGHEECDIILVARDDQHHRSVPNVSTATQPVTGSQSQASANHSQAAAWRANEMLREMGRLKTEMQNLLTPEEMLDTTSPAAPVQTQQPLPQSQQIQSQQTQSQQTQSHPAHSQQTQSQSVLLQRRPVVPSMLEEAGRVLRRVRRQRKVLEENLEALLRAKTGEVLHCQLEALSANRDWTEEVRIKKTVDAWISTLTRDIQAEMATEGFVRSRARDAPLALQQEAAGSRNTGRSGGAKGRPLSAPRGPGSKVVVRGSRGQTDRPEGQTAGRRLNLRPEPAAGERDRERDGERERQRDGERERQSDPEGESYLLRLYGRALYEGHRRTLKKSPYLRFSSPASPRTKTPRPRLVESIRGVKLKSCKTQTSLAPPTAPPLHPSPGQPPRHVFSSSHATSADPADLPATPAESLPVAMAIPLGQPRVDSSRFLLSERPEEATPPPAPPTSNMAAVELRPAE